MSAKKNWQQDNPDHDLIHMFLFGLGPFAKIPYRYNPFYQDCRRFLDAYGWLTERQTEAVRKQMNRILNKDPKDSSPFYDD